MKLCKDCKHFVPSDAHFINPEMNIKYGVCERAPKQDGYHYTGTKCTDDFHYCATVRDAGWLDSRLFGKCGKEARFWEPK